MAGKPLGREWVSAVTMSRLMPVLPSVLGLLKEHDPMAADMFLEGMEPDRAEVDDLMVELLKTLDLNGGDLSMLELRYAFTKHAAAVWLSLVRVVMISSWPRIIPDRVAMELLGCLPALNEARTPLDCCCVLGPVLDKIPRSRSRVLAEFFIFLRDTSSSAEDMAVLVGPFLLLPASLLTSEGTSLIASQTAASAAIADILIQEAEPMFGRVAVAAPYGHPLGVRPKGPGPGSAAAPAAQGTGVGGKLRASLKNGLRRLSQRGAKTKPAPPPGLGGAAGGKPAKGARKPPPAPPRNRAGSTGTAATMATAASSSSASAAAKASGLVEKRKNQLRVFYQWRDPRRSDRVDVLFDMYAFEDLALSIQRKYFMLPPGWKEQLEYMLIMGNRNLQWFAMLKQGVLPPPTDAKPQFAAAALTAGARGPARAPQEASQVDRVVNEIADTEAYFNSVLNDLLDNFVNRIKAIAQGLQGEAAQRALGLSSDRIEQVFGARLQRVAEVSSNLLSDLEVVTLVRVQPKSGVSRLELVCRVFIETAHQLYVFAPFAAGHKAAVTSLKEAANALEGAAAAPSPLRRMGSFLGAGNARDLNRPKSFLEIWHEVSSASDLLRGQTLEAILIMPVQRVPRYRLLFEQLTKATPADDPSFPQLEESVEIVMGLAEEMNEAIRQHERLVRHFGEDFLGAGPHPAAPRGVR